MRYNNIREMNDLLMDNVKRGLLSIQIVVLLNNRTCNYIIGVKPTDDLSYEALSERFQRCNNGNCIYADGDGKKPTVYIYDKPSELYVKKVVISYE